jgi:hypothetical protein
MWALVHLVGPLLPMHDRRWMWLFGGVFQLTTSVFYWLRLAVMVLLDAAFG